MRDFPSQFVPDDRPADQRDALVVHGVKFGGVRNNRGELVPTVSFVGCPARGEGHRDITMIIETPEAWHELAEAVARHAEGAYGSGGWATRVDPSMN